MVSKLYLSHGFPQCWGAVDGSHVNIKKPKTNANDCMKCKGHYSFNVQAAADSQYLEAVAQRCSVKKVFLKNSQNSQENTCARVSFLIKLQTLGVRPATLLKKRLWHRCFPGSFAKVLKITFLTEHLWWLHLNLRYIYWYIDSFCYSLFTFLLFDYEYSTNLKII